MSLSPITLTMAGDAVALLTLSAPPRNEMNSAFFAAFRHIAQAQLPMLAAHGLIVTGVGRHFSSGADVEELRRILAGTDAAGADAIAGANTAPFSLLEGLPYPVVAAVNGCCLGSGFELALACDLRIATPQAVFGFPETTFGLMPGCGGTVRAARLCGESCAAELILSGRMFGADDALSMGLVDRIVDRHALAGAAIAAVRTLRARGWSRPRPAADRANIP